MNNRLVKEIREALLYKDIYNKNYLCELLSKTLVDSEEGKLEQYNRGREDAWQLVRKLLLETFQGGFGCDEQREIFGCDWRLAEVVRKHKTYSEVIAKVEAYEKKKEEETKKKMTVEEIEKQLGYKIEIVSDK